MKQPQLLPISIQRYMKLYPESSHLDHDLILTDFSAFTLPAETRRMKCVFIGLCLSGNGSYTASAIRHDFKANDVIIVGEGQVLGDIRMSSDFQAEALLISRNMLDSVIADVHNINNLFVFAMEHPVVHLSADEAGMLKEYVSHMKMKLNDQSHVYRKQLIGVILAAAIYEVANASQRLQKIESTAGTRSEKVFQQFIQLVEENYREIRRVSWYSERMKMSSKTLLEVVKRVSNRTPNEWLTIYTIMEMRHLLRHTSMPVKEISDRLHFSSQGAMGKFFKENVGISPTSYREE